MSAVCLFWIRYHNSKGGGYPIRKSSNLQLESIILLCKKKRDEERKRSSVTPADKVGALLTLHAQARSHD